MVLHFVIVIVIVLFYLKNVKQGNLTCCESGKLLGVNKEEEELALDNGLTILVCIFTY